MRILVSLGADAVATPVRLSALRRSAARAASPLAAVADRHDLVVVRGDTPHPRALASALSVSGPGGGTAAVAAERVAAYLFEAELGNALPVERPVTTVLTACEVRPGDPRRFPRRVLQTRTIEWLLARGCVVVCSGGGGLPSTYDPATRHLVAVETHVESDRVAAVLAADLDADLLVLTGPDPDVAAACHFAWTTGRPAALGALRDLPAIVAGHRGTWVTVDATGAARAR